MSGTLNQADTKGQKRNAKGDYARLGVRERGNCRCLLVASVSLIYDSCSDHADGGLANLINKSRVPQYGRYDVSGQVICGYRSVEAAIRSLKPRAASYCLASLGSGKEPSKSLQNPTTGPNDSE